MNRFYFVRHGENWANITKEFSYKLVDYSLTPKGVLQAEQTAEAFAGVPLAAIYTSPLKRAAETAAILGGRLGLPVHTREALREINVGAMEGLAPTVEAWRRYMRVVDAWAAGDLAASFPDGDSFHTLWARLRSALAQIIDEQPGAPVLIVAHGGIFTSTLTALCPSADAALLREPNHNCSISEILVKRRGDALYGELVGWAACGHLSGEAALMTPAAPDLSSTDEPH
jgi:broad specificity phosphatase PhoE